MEYMLAYTHIFLKSMSLVYPRQQLVWGKEWNDFVDKLQSGEVDDDPISASTAKIDDLEKRYPLYDLL